jgi:DNA polymerase III delta subunit
MLHFQDMTLFFYGANSYALRKQLAQMIEAYRAKAGSDYGLDRIDGAAVKARDLGATLQASPFLASSRLVIVEGAAANKPVAEKLAQIMEHVPPTTVAVFVEREVDQRTTAFRTLSKADKVMKFEPVTGPKLLGWLKAEAERLGGTADPAALRELVETAGEDQWRLEGEINKLVNYEPHITVEAVRELVAPSVERSIFDLVEAMAAGRAAAALSGFHALLRQKESEIYILTMVQWQLRNLLLAKTAPDLSPAELAKAAGMSPFVAGKMMSAQSGLSEGRLKEAFMAAADCDYDIKSGRLKAEAAVEQLIYRVASRVQTQ